MQPFLHWLCIVVLWFWGRVKFVWWHVYFSLSHNSLEAGLCLLLHSLHPLHERRDDVPCGEQFSHHIGKHIDMLIVSVDVQHTLVLFKDGECFGHLIRGS